MSQPQAPQYVQGKLCDGSVHTWRPGAKAGDRCCCRREALQAHWLTPGYSSETVDVPERGGQVRVKEFPGA